LQLWFSRRTVGAITDTAAAQSKADGPNAGNNSATTTVTVEDPERLYRWRDIFVTDWSNSGAWDPPGVPGTNGTAVIKSGIASVTSPVTVARLCLECTPGAAAYWKARPT
jgi:hypothetical protein